MREVEYKDIKHLITPLKQALEVMDLDLIDFLMVNYHMDMKDSNQEEPRWQYFSYTISSRYQSLQDSDKMSKYLFYQL